MVHPHLQAAGVENGDQVDHLKTGDGFFARVSPRLDAIEEAGHRPPLAGRAHQYLIGDIAYQDMRHLNEYLIDNKYSAMFKYAKDENTILELRAPDPRVREMGREGGGVTAEARTDRHGVSFDGEPRPVGLVGPVDDGLHDADDASRLCGEVDVVAAAAQGTEQYPDGSTGCHREYPYRPDARMGVDRLTRLHPTFDGRGVTIAVIEAGGSYRLKSVGADGLAEEIQDAAHYPPGAEPPLTPGHPAQQPA